MSWSWNWDCLSETSAELRNLPPPNKLTLGLALDSTVFSEYELSDDVLREAFGDNEVLWVYRKSWAAYPEAPVFTDDEAFPSFKPDNSSNFYYVSAFERWVSTMETEVR